MNRQADNEYWQLIWEKFKAGERFAFETIYNEFVDVLFAYGSKITSDRPLLEDSIQDLFIDVYAFGNSLHKPESLEYYLFKTLKRIIIRKLKDQNKIGHSETTLEHFDLKFPLEDYDNSKAILEGQLALLQKELQNLDADKRELIFLKFNSGLTYTEIGNLLHLKPDTVKKQIYRLLQYMRGKLGETFMELFLMCFKA